MIVKYESKLFPVLEPCFMQLLQKFMDLMPKPLDGTSQAAASHIAAMLLVLQRHYFLVIQHMVSHDLAAVMLSDRNLSHLEGVLSTIVTGIVEVGPINPERLSIPRLIADLTCSLQVDDPNASKNCLNIIRNLVRCWVPKARDTARLDAKTQAAFVSFVMEKVLNQCIPRPDANIPWLTELDTHSRRTGCASSSLISIILAVSPSGPRLAQGPQRTLPSFA